MKKDKNIKKDNSAQDIESKIMLRQMKEEARKEKIRAILAKYRKKIIAFSSIAALIVITLISFELYQHNKNIKYSKLLHKALILENRNQNPEIFKILDQIINNNSTPESLKTLALMQKANKLVAQNNIKTAVEYYIKASKIKNSDPYFQDLAGLLAIKSMIDSGNSEFYDKIENLIKIFEKKSLVLKSFIIEQKAIFAWIKGDKKTAYDIFYNLSLDVEAPKQLKNRAMEFSKIVK